MNYTTMTRLFRQMPVDRAGEMPLQDLQLRISRHPFTSVYPEIPEVPCSESGPVIPGMPEDARIDENLHFEYTMISPSGSTRFKRVILLLHGLNEKSWNKYLPWAVRLATALNRPVILFPISFHMNRSPESWSNPRLMTELMKKNRTNLKDNDSSSFANIALSLRLTADPMRFYKSGSQSHDDLRRLITGIEQGTHPFLDSNTQTDIFAYSIGAFLSQILFLNHGEDLLGNSRLFMFCGGAPFSKMNGVSKHIMNEEAFAALNSFYLREADTKPRTEGTLGYCLNSSPAGRAFRAMLTTTTADNWRKNRFDRMAHRIYALGLSKDKVINPSGLEGFLHKSMFEVMDFPFAYSHENPFPVIGNGEETDLQFNRVFDKAASFLC